MPYLDWYPNLYHARIPGSGRATLLVDRLATPGLSALLLRTLSVFRPDIVLLIKCHQLPLSFYKHLRRLVTAKIFAFHPDDPFAVGGSRALAQMHAVDAYFVWSQQLVDRARANGANAYYLPFASDPDLHHPVPLSDEDRRMCGAQVSFIGNWDAERERWLKPLSAFRLAIWGSDYWDYRCRDRGVRGAWQGRVAMGQAMVKVVLASAINLNILRIQNKDACNMRTFEIPACGGFMLHERSKDLGALFRIGVECDDFGSEEELLQKVGYYLEHPAERDRIAQLGLLAAARHTYADWARRILELFYAGSTNFDAG
jgi:spore maturation protein CgeB